MKNRVKENSDEITGDRSHDVSTHREWNYNRSLIEASLDPFVAIDQQGIVTDVNNAAVAITGISRDQLIDSEFSRYFTEPQNAETSYKQAFSEGKIYDFELKLKHIEGNVTPVLLNASTFTNSDNEVMGVFVTLRDITSTRKIEDELIHLKNNLELLVKQRAAELITANIELAFQNEEKDKRAAELIIANKELAFQNEEKDKRASELIIANKELAFQNDEKYQRASELVIANKELAFQNEEKDKRASELIIANKELAFQNDEKYQRASELVIANKELAFQNDEKYQRASELVIANKELVLQSEEKKIKEMQTNILKEQNVVLEMQKKQLDEASHLKSSFLSNMSHELRTPLNAIVGFTDLALKTNLNTRQRNYLSKIKISSHTLLGLISDILDLSKIEAGKLELEMATFDLEEVMQNAVNQVSTKSQEKGLVLNYFIDEDVPLSLRGDSLRLGQILINLSSNAVKFTEKGKVEIKVKLLENNGNHVLLQFSVNDTGIGMTELQMKKLFQPFSQADTSTTRKYGGTGLGLSISHELITMMHGEIWVESNSGEGSTFYFTIKIDIADKVRLKHFKNKFEKWGIKVLVVDTQNESRELIGNMLAEMSLDVTLCGSGQDALSILEIAKKNKPFDLVIMDWKMNDMDGIETARRIKQLYAFTKSPAIILMTSFLNQGVQEKAEQIGLREGVLYKPVTPSLLFNSIIQVCYKDDFEQVGEVIEKNFENDRVPHLWHTKVLLVEDNEINREVAQEILQEAGLDVTLAKNGKEAVDMVNANSFDIVLMDIQMPIMDGYDATREIRKNPKFSDLPIIAMTANALLSDQLDCYNAGMNDHIAKPINTNQLFHTIALWIKKEQEEVTVNDQTLAVSEVSSFTKPNDIHLESPGIDVQAGLNRLGGNQKLYFKLLYKFQKNHKHVIEEINYALSHEDQKTAERLVHSIKGAAGNLSIQDVFLDASTLETAFKINKLNFVDLLLEKLELSLEQSFTTISALENMVLGTQDLKEGSEEPFQLQVSLDKLENLLYDNDIDALECIDTIVRHTKASAFADKAEALKELIDQYDFDNAISVFNDMRLMIRKELNNGKEQ